MMNEYDMHVHTMYSDGVLKPNQILNIAFSSKIGGIAITDHDTVEGIDDAMKLDDMGIEIIPGIELSTIYSGEDIHLLGYWIDYHNKEFLDTLSEIRDVRIQRVEKMVRNLYDYYKIKLDLNEVLNEGEHYAIGRPHIARVLIKHGYVDSVSGAFERYLNKDSPIYVEKYELSPKEAVNMIIKSNGAPVLAHPGLIKDKSLIPKIIEAGIYGIEVYHPKHSTGDINLAKVFAEKYNLVQTGGSDFHSPQDDIIGKCTILHRNVIELKKKLKAIKEVF